MASSSRGFDALQDVVDAVLRAPTLHDSLSALCLSLPRPFHAWWGAVAVSGDESSAIAAVWAASGSSVVEPGMVISWNVTPEARAFVDVLSGGRPVVIRLAETDFGMVGDLLMREGCASVAMVPLAAGDGGVTIVVAGSSPDGFRQEDVPFLTGVQKGVESHVLDLVRRTASEAGG